VTDQIEEDKPKQRAVKETLPKDIGTIIPLIRKELGAISKNQETTGPGTKYSFRGHDQVVNAIVPLLNKYGVYTTVEDESLFYEGRNAGNKYATASLLREAVTFWAPDGSNRTTTIVAESVDYGNKATGQASTYAYRLALTKTFTIPTGDPDPDEVAQEFDATSEPSHQAPPAQPKPVVAGKDEVNALKQEIAASYAAIGVDASEIPVRGTKFFNGREGWDANVTALKKLLSAIQAGDEAAIGK